MKKKGKKYMKITALEVDRYQHMTHGFKSLAADKETEPLLKKLAEILDHLEPQGINNYHSVFVCAPRPTFRHYFESHGESSYEEASEEEIAQVKKDYRDYFPTPFAWFRLGIKHFTRNTGEEFYGMFLNNSVVFTINDCNEHFEYNGTDLLNWAIGEAEKAVDAVRDGTYKDFLNNIPYCYRTGEIKRSDYWEVYPSKKRSFLASYNADELELFRTNFASEQIHGTLLPQMTARIFYEACAVIYRALGKGQECSSYRFSESAEEKSRYGNEPTPKEMYYANADGRDDGLKNVPLDDPRAYEEWKQYKAPYYEFNGSHPWEIIPAFSISLSMHLFPTRTDSGYYFRLSGEPNLRAPETIIAANALVKAGYPVLVDDYNKIINRIDGEDNLKIIPVSSCPFRENAIWLPKGAKGKAIAERAVWETYEYIIKGESNKSNN